MKLSPLFIAIVIASASLLAQEKAPTFLPAHSVRFGKVTVDFSGSYRLRGEDHRGYSIKRYADRDERLLLSRLRLEAELRIAGVLSAHLQLQDSRSAGVSLSDHAFSGNNPYRDPLDINQAYVSLTPQRMVTLTIGRQPIFFRDRRFFGAGNWSNTGRYIWDAAVIRFDNRFVDSRWIIGRFIYHKPQVWPNRAADNPTTAAVYTAVKGLPLQLDLFYVHKAGRSPSGNANEGRLSSHSVGFWLKKEWGAWDAGVAMVAQFGTQAAEKIRAFGSAVYLSRYLDADGTWRASAQFSRGSGDKRPSDGVLNTFDGVFGGAAPDFYGFMNLFFWKNLQEYRLDLTFRPIPKLSLSCQSHYFMLDKKHDAWFSPGGVQRIDSRGSSGRDLGHEIDLSIRHAVTPHFEWMAGYCLFLPGKYVKNTGAAPVCHFVLFQTMLFF